MSGRPEGPFRQVEGDGLGGQDGLLTSRCGLCYNVVRSKLSVSDMSLGNGRELKRREIVQRVKRTPGEEKILAGLILSAWLGHGGVIYFLCRISVDTTLTRVTPATVTPIFVAPTFAQYAATPNATIVKTNDRHCPRRVS